MDHIVEGRSRILEENIEGFLRGEVRNNGKVDFAFPVGVGSENFLGLFLRSHCSGNNVSLLGKGSAVDLPGGKWWGWR